MGCDLLGARHVHAQPRRREVIVAGKRAKVIDVHAHCAVPEAMALMGIKFGGPSVRPDLHIERACEQAVQTESFRSTAQRLSQRIAYLNGAAFAERAAADYRYKGEIIKALEIKVE